MGNSRKVRDITGHYVYHLRTTRSPKVVYVGRGVDPEDRRRRAGVRYGLKLRFAYVSEPLNIEESCELERADIRKLSPKFNERVVSSLGMLGMRHSEESKQKIGKALTGRPQSELCRKRLKEVHTGKLVSESTRALIRATRTGTTIPEKVRRKMSESQQRNAGAQSLRKFIYHETRFRMLLGYVPLTKQEILNAA